ncbi:ABC transporter permease subunit [Lapillicoccus sp.]|uniref:ABC transporter permease subunit n=1 Tax=Lapillicoccus sp. TaxID=1909287 RepID=UPI003982E988
MILLVRVELRRFFARRLTRIAGAGVLAVMAIALFAAQQKARDSTPERIQERVGLQLQQCRDAQAETRRSDPTANFHCDEMAASMQGAPVAFVGLTTDLLSGLAVVMAVIGFLVGAGFVAAEFTTGNLATWLTFEPRRTRVYASKLIAAGLGSIPVTAPGVLTLAVGIYWLTTSYGVAGAVSGAQVVDLAWLVVRVVVVSAAAAVGGAVLGGLLRNTAAALGVLLGYAVLVEVFFALISSLVPDPRPWVVQPNFQAWVGHDLTYLVDSCTNTDQGLSCQNVERILTFGHASIYLSVLVTVFVALGAWVFTRRDVS